MCDLLSELFLLMTLPKKAQTHLLDGGLESETIYLIN